MDDAWRARRERWREASARWRIDRLKGALGRSPERKPRFSTISGRDIDRLYTPARDDAGDPLHDVGFPGAMRLVVDTIEFGTRELPKWNTVSISGYHIREAGSTAVQELAFTIADGMAYVEAAMARGLRIDDFAPRLSFFFNSHSDFFEEIAKFRAARRIWWRAMTERYRAENERSTWMRFHTQTAGVSLTAQQPLDNLTRVATQALAAILGGTQSLHTDAYDEAWPVPSAEAARLALRQQQILAAETGVANTVDPLGGSWFVEALTDETERDAWRYLDEIDGLGEALEIPLLEVSEDSLRGHLARLERTRRERDPGAVESSLARLRGLAGRPGSTESNLMPALVTCAKAYCTLGEMCGVFRAVFGEYREPVAV